MTIIGEAAAALARLRAVNGALHGSGGRDTTAGSGGGVAVETAYARRVRAAMAREVAVMLGVAPSRVVVSADPVRGYGGEPGVLIGVHEPDPDPCGPSGPAGEGRVWRFVPETGNTGLGGGAYLLLDECPAGCGGGNPSFGPGEGMVPMVSVSMLADLGRYLEFTRPVPHGGPDPDDGEDERPEVPVEFFDDPGHGTGCPMR